MNEQEERDLDREIGKRLLYISDTLPIYIGEFKINLVERGLECCRVELLYKDVLIFSYEIDYDLSIISVLWFIPLSYRHREKIRDMISAEYYKQYKIKEEQHQLYTLEQDRIREQQLKDLNTYLEEL